jgi:Fe-S cluster assembly protein SufD
LDVHTDDVRASHGAKTHKLNDDKLFYLQAKGVSLQEAKKLFLESYINKVFSKLAAHDPDMIELEKNKLLQTIIL